MATDAVETGTDAAGESHRDPGSTPLVAVAIGAGAGESQREAGVEAGDTRAGEPHRVACLLSADAVDASLEAIGTFEGTAEPSVCDDLVNAVRNWLLSSSALLMPDATNRFDILPKWHLSPTQI